jgi:hypothetical protein
MYKQLAKNHYGSLKVAYDAINVIENKSEMNIKNMKMIRSQIQIYAGINNGDRALFRKGVNNFDKYSLELLDFTRTQETIHGLYTRLDDEFTETKNEETYRQLGSFISKKHKYYHELLDIENIIFQ